PERWPRPATVHFLKSATFSTTPQSAADCFSRFPTCIVSSKVLRAMYPQTRRDDVKEVLHGTEVRDPYRWLEDQNSPETRAWITSQNKYTESILGRVPEREAIRQRLTALMKVDAIAVPFERNGWYFYSKRAADQNLPVIYVRKGIDGPEEVLIDPHPM